MKPDACSSTMCSNLGCDYCKECSHGTFLGEGQDAQGKIWRWEFSGMFGPLFVRKNGEPLKNQPVSKNDHAWEAFTPWHDEFKKAEKDELPNNNA